MNKIMLRIAAAFVPFALLSCEKTDAIRDEIDSLRGRIEALEAQVGTVNEQIGALHKLMDGTLVIVGVEPTSTGYTIQFSDGTSKSVVVGDRIEALVPLMNIDAEGFWTVSYDDGATSERLIVNGQPVPAWPLEDGQPAENAAGVTPQLRVDADGNWLVSTDGVNYTPLLQHGEKVSALGSTAEVSYSGFFKTVVYDRAKQELRIELLTGDRLTLPVDDGFGLTIAADAVETFCLAHTRQFAVTQRGVAEAILKAPAGWRAVLDDEVLTLTSPAAAAAPQTDDELAVIVTSDRGYVKSVKMRLRLLDKPLDADACEAWQKYAAGASDNVLLDYSYAGYKRGETAPPEVATLGYTVYNVVDYGADPTGRTSSRGALVTLLEKLRLSGVNAAGNNQANADARAVIYFPEGRFVLHNDEDNTFDTASVNTELDAMGNNRSHEIFIRGGNFVLKGAGRDRTTLVMDTPNLPSNPKKMWSSPVMLNIKHNAGLSDLTSVTADAAKGAFEVRVASTAGIAAGDWVCLYLSNNDPELVAAELAPHVVDNGQMTNIQTITVTDYHEVRSVSGSTVTFREPLLHDVHARWGWKICKYPHYENVGVEDLAFEGRSKEDFGHHVSWRDDGAYKPLNMMRLANSWIRRVDFRSVSEALSIVSSANCSAYEIEISGNRGHSAVRSQASSRVFIGKVRDHSSGRECTSSSGLPGGPFNANAGQYHASGVSETALGTVLWNNTWGDDALFESHSRQPRATLVDRCMGGFVQWRFGGDEASVPNHLRDLTIWNLRATTAKHDFGGGKFQWWLTSDAWWKVMPPIIVGFHGAAVDFDQSPEQLRYLESNGTKVEPESLYEAQLRERLGYVPAWLNTLK